MRVNLLAIYRCNKNVWSPEGDSYGMSEKDKPTQPRAIAMSDGSPPLRKKRLAGAKDQFYSLI